MKKNIISLFTITAFVFATILFAAETPKGDTKVKKIGKMQGQVVFSHSKHEKKGVKKCTDCHHKGELTDSCGKCHPGKEGREAIHKGCKDCHKKMKGPMKCPDCHPKK